MKARKLYPVLLLLLLLAVTSLVIWFGDRSTTADNAGQGKKSETAQAQAVAPLLPPTNDTLLADQPVLTGPGLTPPSVAPGTGPITAVLAAPGSDPTAQTQAPPQTTKLTKQLKRIRPARLTDLASLRDPSTEVGKTRSDRRFQFDLFPGLSLSATAQSLEILAPESGETIRGVYTGSIDNVPGSLFTLAYNDGAISASIAAGPYGHYQIQPAPGGWYRVSEANLNLPNFCGASAEASRAVASQHSGSPVPANGEGYISDVVPSKDAANNPTTISNIKILIIYSDDLESDYGGQTNIRAVIDAHVAFANQTFTNSQAGASLSTVSREKRAYNETGSLEEDLLAITNYDGILDDVHDRRNALAADLVSFWVLETELNETGELGLAWLPPIGTESELGFSAVRPVFNAVTFIHEVGHNLGCDHNKEDADGGRFPFSFGYRVEVNDVLYMDVMSYNPLFGDYLYVQSFSNPRLKIFGNIPFGKFGDDASGADNARTINLSAPAVAAFRPLTFSGPPAPQGVTATDKVYPSTVVIQWSPVANVAGYQVFRSDTNNPNNAIALGATSDVRVDDNSVSPGKTYYYFVKSIDNQLVPGPFSQGDAGSAKDPALGNISVAASDGTDYYYITVAFNQVGGANKYTIYRGITDNPLEAEFLSVGYAPEYKDTSAKAGVNYRYWVQATQTGATPNDTKYSNRAGPDIGYLRKPPIPGSVGNVQANSPFPNTHIRLTWGAASDAAYYQVVRGDNSGDTPGFSPVMYESPWEGAREFRDFTAEPGKTYYYWVRAINGSGAGPYSSRISFTIPRGNLLPPPANFNASDGTEEIKIIIKWDAVGGANGYALYFSETNNLEDAELVLTPGPNTREITDFGTRLEPDNRFQPERLYYYWVRTANSQGVLGDFSAPNSGYIKPPKPDKPQNLVASNGLFLDFVQLTWDHTYGAKKFAVYRGENSGNLTTKLATVNATTLEEESYLDRTATPGKLYYYKVVPLNSQGVEGLHSNVDSGYRENPANVGPPLIPLDLRASNDRVKDILISWTGTEGSSQYRVYRNSVNATGGTLIKTTEGTTVIDRDVEPEVTYYYSVQSESAGGISPFSNVDSGEAQLPDPAEDLTLSLTENELKVGAPIGTVIGTFEVDVEGSPNTTRTFSFALVDIGTADDDDNILFDIVDDELRSDFVPTEEEEEDGDDKTIVVRATDNADPFIYAQEQFTIVLIPANSTTSSLVVNPSSGNLVLSWPKLEGTHFQVQRNTSLSESGWTNLGGVTSQRMMVIDTASGVPSCYYRVVKVNPTP